ncbi:MAG: hypothetical protein ACREQF_12935, partial [Candidatus Binataceae bacterium]
RQSADREQEHADVYEPAATKTGERRRRTRGASRVRWATIDQLGMPSNAGARPVGSGGPTVADVVASDKGSLRTFGCYQAYG